MEDRIVIPQSLERILSQDTNLYGSTMLTLRVFHPWVRSSGMPFFPAFTDHSERHIAEVLSTASSIIADEARRHLSPGDVSVLVLATLLHDSAMHLTEDGFRSLVNHKSQRLRIEGFGDKPWPIIWSDFLSEAARFDGRQLARIFGESEPPDPRRIDINNLSELDKLLVGEFLRRHHARLAHEIALLGVPGPSSKVIGFREVPEDIADLAGLVARSHNLPIRATYNFLSERYDLREYRGVHSVFLMAVLRVADYMQVQRERAEEELLRVKTLRSPFSRREWATHFAVRDVRSSHEDPEAIFIDANPQTASLFLKLSELTKDMQDELDSCWAALGEVYGRYPPLDELGLTIRRIRSNLDDPQEFAKKVDYLPIAAAFSTAGTDLLKLLIGPLYGDHPEVGVRELIQNAVDACREKKDWVLNHKLDLSAEPADPPDVLVTIEQSKSGERSLTITDKGIGMTADVIRDYFLRAGASFRYSEAWRREHEDESGRSRVLRGGRFGVGALAAFLLGIRLEVVTRHVSAPPDRAIAFHATLESESLELRYVSAPTGTSIRIVITDEIIWNALNPYFTRWSGRRRKEPAWDELDWYLLDSPSLRIVYRDKHAQAMLESEYSLPDSNAVLPAGWHRVNPREYEDVQWTFEDAPLVTVNGIRVTSYHFDDDLLEVLWKAEDSHFSIKRPKLSVFDPQGVFPLNLQRTSVTAGGLSFDEDLIKSIAEDFIAFVLANAPDAPLIGLSGTERMGELNSYPALGHDYDSEWVFNVWPFLMLRAGLMLFDYSGEAKIPLRRIYGLASHSGIEVESFKRLPPDAAFAFFPFGENNGSAAGLIRAVFGEGDQSQLGIMGELPILASRLVLSRGDWDYIQRPRSIRRDLRERLVVEWEDKNSVVIAVDSSQVGSPADLLKVSHAKATKGPRLMVEWVLSENALGIKPPSPLGKVWQEQFGLVELPFDRAERERRFADVFVRMRKSIEHYVEVRRLWHGEEP